MQPGRIAILLLVVGLALGAIGIGLFALTQDPTVAGRFAFTGIPIAFVAGSALVLARLLPREPAVGRTVLVVLGGMALLVGAAIPFFFRYRDPMILVFGVQAAFLFLFAAVAVLLLRRTARRDPAAGA